MQELAGIPTGTLAAALTLVLGAGLAVLAALALRNPIFVRLGLRNIPRRRGRSVLIVAGLMLGTTIVAAALATGDTMSHTIRSSVLGSLGNTDVLVSVEGTSVESIAIGDSPQIAYFPESRYETVRDAVADSPLVDGVAPAIIQTVAVENMTRRQREPRITLFASDPRALAEGFGEIRAGGAPVGLELLETDEVYLNAEAAEALGAEPGDRLRLHAGRHGAAAIVRDVVEYPGAGTDGAAVIMRLSSAAPMLGVPGQIEHVLISNRGDEVSGAEVSDEVLALVRPVVEPMGLQADPEKRDGLDIADAQGAAFMSLFTTFGSFSIAAGVLLIFLIFVMLAAERRGELGIARAVGTRRGHLVQMYLFEGVAYDLAAAVVGVVLGAAVAYGMVFAMAAALGTFGVDVLYQVTARSLVIAYALGVLLTLIVVAVSAWRVSVLTIATAVRNLPEPPKQRSRRRRAVLPVAALLLGALLTVSGISSANAVPFMLGVSLVLIGLALAARALGGSDRAAFSVAGAVIVVFWLLPFDTFTFIADFSMSYGVFLVGGLMIVVGATWTLIYNAGLLLRGLAWSLGRFRAVAPVLRLAIAYPLRSLFRTGVTLAMFTLVVFTLVVGITISGSFNKAIDDLESFGGGFDVRAVSAPASPLGELEPALSGTAGVPRGAVEVAASQAIVPLEARQVGAGRDYENYPVTGVDDAFLGRTTYGLAAMAKGYGSAEEVWEALRREKNLAVVDPYVVPRRDDYGGGVLPDFRLSGFFVDDGRFEPVPVEVRDAQTGQTLTLTVIGVLSDTAPEVMIGLTTSQRTLFGALGARAAPTVYWLDLAAGADARAFARSFESAFVANGVEAEALEQTMADVTAASRTFNYIVEGFMGLGLVVGVAALGVISARAVVERRQQIGVLRAIGFRRGAIQATFLIESSFVALTAILVGTLLGLGIAYNVIADVRQQPSWAALPFAVPWLSLAVVFVVVYAVALLTTLAPALRASRIYPAEALRYQ